MGTQGATDIQNKMDIPITKAQTVIPLPSQRIPPHSFNIQMISRRQTDGYANYGLAQPKGQSPLAEGAPSHRPTQLRGTRRKA